MPKKLYKVIVKKGDKKRRVTVRADNESAAKAAAKKRVNVLG